MQQRMTIIGMKRSKGVIQDTGQPFDSTKVYVLTRLDDRKGDAKGHTGAEFNIGVSGEFGKYEHLPFPFEADCEIELMTTGSQMRQVITSLVPVVHQKQPVKA